METTCSRSFVVWGSRETGDTDRGGLWSQGYSFSLTFSWEPLEHICVLGWGVGALMVQRRKEGAKGTKA